MESEERAPIKLNISTGIIGVTTCTTSVGDNSKTTNIQRSGSMVHNVIPSVIVVCEDALAKMAIEKIAGDLKGSFKIITAGAWDNMPVLLYGIYFYREQLIASGDKRHLEVVCVLDGDIRERDFKEGLDRVHRGIHVPDDVKKALSQINENLVGFKLIEIKPIGGLPEYHHKMWLEEISDEIIDNHHEVELSKHEMYFNCARKEDKPGVGVLLALLRSEIAEVKRIVGCSRQVPFHTLRDGKNKIDCHAFYDELEGQLRKGDSLLKYPLHDLNYTVLTLIKKYNPERWEMYIAPVKKAMQEAFDRHVKMFRSDRFNLTELGEES